MLSHKTITELWGFVEIEIRALLEKMRAQTSVHKVQHLLLADSLSDAFFKVYLMGGELCLTAAASSSCSPAFLFPWLGREEKQEMGTRRRRPRDKTSALPAAHHAAAPSPGREDTCALKPGESSPR